MIPFCPSSLHFLADLRKTPNKPTLTESRLSRLINFSKYQMYLFIKEFESPLEHQTQYKDPRTTWRVSHWNSWLSVTSIFTAEHLSPAVITTAYLLGGLLYPSRECLQPKYFSKAASAPTIL